MDLGQIYLAIINVFAILLIWVRIESRMSRLEGRFDMFVSLLHKELKIPPSGH